MFNFQRVKFKRLTFLRIEKRELLEMDAKRQKLEGQNDSGDGVGDANKIPIRTLWVGPVEADVSYSRFSFHARDGILTRGTGFAGLVLRE